MIATAKKNDSQTPILDQLLSEVAKLLVDKTGVSLEKPAKALYTRREAAEYLGMSTTKFDDLRREGKIAAKNVGADPRFTLDELDKFIQHL